MRRQIQIMALPLFLSSVALAQEPTLQPAPVQAQLPPQPSAPPSPPPPSGKEGAPAQGQPQYPGVNPDRFSASPSEGEPRQASSVPVIGAKRLLRSLEELDRPLSPEVITAYGSSVQTAMPMSPELIRDYRRRVDASQKAAAMPPSGFRARPINDAIRVSLSAGQPLQSFYVTPNTVSVMSFYDKTGKAWPVASYVVGRADSFQVFALQEGSNQIAITPLINHGYSNIVVSLVEEDRPIVINLETSDVQTNFRRDITVEGYGPNAKRDPIPVAAKTPPSDGVMMAFAQGAAIPRGAARLNTTDESVEAWSYQGQIYVRTSDTLQTPSPNQALTGPGGVHAYRVKPTPMLLINRNGSVMNVRIAR